MSNLYIKNTLDSLDSRSNVWLFGDSIAGYWSYTDRFDGWFFKMINHYKSKGFNIEGHDASINGGYSYNSRSSTYSIPAYVTGGRPGRIAGYTIDDAVADGATDIIWAMTNNDVLSSYTDPNPAGFNNATDEQYDILKDVQSICDTNGINLTVFTQNTRQSTLSVVPTYKQISEDLQGALEFNMFDNFNVLADPNNNYLGKAGYYLNDVHPNNVGNDAVYTALIDYIDEYYSLTQTVYELISDTPCTAESGQQQLQIIDGIAQVIDGKFQFILIL